MKIAVLSRKPSLYSTKRFVQAARARGHSVKVVDYLRCYMDITSHRPIVKFQGKPISADAIIPRIGASQTFYGTAVVRQFEVAKTFVLNDSQAISRSRDKLRCLQILSSLGVGLPVTGFAHGTKDVNGLIELVGGAPLVVKLLEGTQGIGVVLAETQKAAESVIEAFRGLNANILVQEFIKEADGADIRAIVLGGKVIAAMERRALAGEIRSNLHRGGSAAVVKLSKDERQTAIREGGAMGLGLCGVDMLRSNRGPVVMEVNSSPGLEGIETTTGLDVATQVIEYLESRVPKPAKRPRKQA